MPRWVPLEANPKVLTDFARTLGMAPALRFTDVWSADLLDMVPAPRHAMLLLFPFTPKLLAAEKNSPAPDSSSSSSTSSPVFIKQTIENACGTIALLHSLLQPEVLAAHPPLEDSALETLGKECAGKTPAECAELIERSNALNDAQKEFAQRGQTAPPGADDKVDLHFVAFVEKDGFLFQLDGRRDAPVNHGPTTHADLLKDACTVVKEQFMAKDPSELRFTIIALVEGSEDF